MEQEQSNGSSLGVFALVLLVLVPLIIGAGTVAVLYYVFLMPMGPPEAPVRLFEIAPGKSTREICTDLQSQGIVRFGWGVCTLARLKGADTGISAGEYELSPSMTPKRVAEKLINREVFERKVTIPEGTAVAGIGPLLEQAGIITKEEFDKEVSNPELLRRLGLDGKSLEGYLFPDTYKFSRPTTAYSVIMRMFDEAEKRWSPSYSDELERIGMSRHELLTLASIIEKETGVVAEQAQISAVFHNRLKVGMKLQADPTVIYGIPNFNGNLTKEDLQAASPYNTYVNFGLPPGPITNPGESAIKAAIFPADVPYLYFCATGSGSHVFSKTLDEHNQAVNRYQRGR